MCAYSVLLAVRVAIAAVSGSLSIIVTTLDAVLDVISGFIIWSTSVAKRARNKYKFPIGQVWAQTSKTLRSNKILKPLKPLSPPLSSRTAGSLT